MLLRCGLNPVWWGIQTLTIVWLANWALLVVFAETPEKSSVSATSRPDNKPEPGKSGTEAQVTLPAPLDATAVASRIDAIIDADLQRAKLQPAPLTTDEDFLRRVTFDLAGTTPEPNEVTLFGLNPDPDKRLKTISLLLESPSYGRNWAQYWREVVFSRATDPRSRLAQRQFESWMEANLTANQGWNQIATQLLTATGNVQENGATALLFAHQGDPEEVASEASRIFMGIQIQCANCHDHPTDKWKREQFHQLAAFFPRVALRRDPDGGPASFNVVSIDAGPAGGRFAEPGAIAREPERFIRLIDRNNDQKIRLDELRNDQFKRVFTQLLDRADLDKDGALTAAELKAMPLPEQPGRGALEHYMPDLNNPADRGQKIDPAFFVTGAVGAAGLKDTQRREMIARLMTSTSNEWFAKAFVNRIWSEMLGEGFFMPIDDIGPERTPNSPEVLNLLSRQFAAHDYDIKWLFRAIANSRTYQRSIRSKSPTETTPTFAAAVPTRLRSDQLYDALTTILGIGDLRGNRSPLRPVAGAGPRVDNSPRGQFNAIFGFDPSTPQDEITGNVPQALFFMNSPLLQSLTSGAGQTRLGRILKDFANDDDALTELYLLVLSRQPSEQEVQICRKYLSQAPSRREGYEDLMWSLLNSSEFLTKR